MYKLYVLFACLVTFLVIPSTTFAQKDTIYYDFSFDLDDWVEFLDDTVKDIHGNRYGTLKLGDQIWLDRNLRVTQFNDGTEIPKVKKEADWLNEENPLCTYGPQHIPTIYYNYPIVENNKVCPVGWHVPSSKDWRVLLNHFDRMNNEYMIIYYDTSNVEPFPFIDVEGVKIGESDSLVTIIKNDSRPFYNESALFFTRDLNGYIKAGERLGSGWAHWWCSDSVNFTQSWYGAIDRPFGLEIINLGDETSSNHAPSDFLSIRCIKDNN